MEAHRRRIVSTRASERKEQFGLARVYIQIKHGSVNLFLSHCQSVCEGLLRILGETLYKRAESTRSRYFIFFFISLFFFLSFSAIL